MWLQKAKGSRSKPFSRWNHCTPQDDFNFCHSQRWKTGHQSEIFRIRLSLSQITLEHPFTNVAIAPALLVSLTMQTLSIQTHNMNWKVFSLSNCCNMSCEKILTLSHTVGIWTFKPCCQQVIETGWKHHWFFFFFHCYTFKLNSCCFGQNLPMKW